jgi:hypothetical protein
VPLPFQSQNPSNPLLAAQKITATTSTGVVIKGDHAEASGKVLDGIGAVKIAPGNIEVPYSVYFAYPAAENTISVLAVSRVQKAVYTDVAIAGAPQMVAELPGQSSWRKSVRWQNREYVAMVPGCFATGSTATCYVNLFPANARGTVAGDVLAYPVTMLQLKNQAVTAGLATVQVGETTFTAIPVR